MKRFNKTQPVMIRMTGDQRLRLEKAARRITNDRRERVDPSTLARELINDGVDRILDPSPAGAAA